MKQTSRQISGQASAKQSSECLVLKYHLDELPTSQHRAGLAGLILLTQWLNQPKLKNGVCEFTVIKKDQATLKLDQEGLTRLFDTAFAATLEERGKEKHAVLIPTGAFLASDNPGDQPWLTLWQEVLISILRKQAMARLPFLKRARGEPTKDAAEGWKKLWANRTEQLSGTYLLGARAQNSDRTLFLSTSRLKFLLHFWPFVMWDYRLTVMNRAGELKVGDFVIGVPDVADLPLFCRAFSRVLQSRTHTPSLICVPAEAGLRAISEISSQLPLPQIEELPPTALLGIDLFQVETRQRDIQIKQITRQSFESSRLEAFPSLTKGYSVLQHQQLLNVIAEQPAWTGVAPLCQREPIAKTIGSFHFCREARNLFHQGEASTMKEKTTEPTGNIPEPHADEAQKPSVRSPRTTIEAAIYQLVKIYLAKKLATRNGLQWKEVIGNKKLIDLYNDKKQALAKEAFYAARSRSSEQDFISYFTETLCSVSQQINEQEFMLVAQSLFEETEKVRTLTLLALSAQS